MMCIYGPYFTKFPKAHHRREQYILRQRGMSMFSTVSSRFDGTVTYLQQKGFIIDVNATGADLSNFVRELQS